jgi:hypothetical protein
MEENLEAYFPFPPPYTEPGMGSKLLERFDSPLWGDHLQVPRFNRESIV